MTTAILHSLGKAIFSFLIFFIGCSIPMLIGHKTSKALRKETPFILAALAGLATFLLTLP